MTTKKLAKRTTIYLPIKLYEEARKCKYNLSSMFSEYLEMELYQDDPEFVEKKLKEFDTNTAKERNVLVTKLKMAKERHQQKNERLVTEEPEAMDYRTRIPKERK